MNKKPIEESQDSDLRLSKAALLRAAVRARELAEQTGTSSFDSKPAGEKQDAGKLSRQPAVHEKGADYGKKP
jgi:hypothetical protein